MSRLRTFFSLSTFSFPTLRERQFHSSTSWKAGERASDLLPITEEVSAYSFPNVEDSTVPTDLEEMHRDDYSHRA